MILLEVAIAIFSMSSSTNMKSGLDFGIFSLSSVSKNLLYPAIVDVSLVDLMNIECGDINNIR